MELQVWESQAIKGKGGVKRKDIDDMWRPDREGLEVFDSWETMWQQIHFSSIHLLLQCQHLKMCCYWEECVYVGQTGGVRFTCQCSPVLQFFPRGWRWLSLQHCESCLDEAELDLAGSKDTFGCLKCSVCLPHAAEFLSPGSLWEAAINCCSLCFYSPTVPRLLTHTLLFLFLCFVCI